MSIVTGEYNTRYYLIFLDGEEIYRAGNYKLESSTIVPESSEFSVDIETMKKYCKISAEEIAEENEAMLGEVIYCETPE